jgi:cytochrome c biogenesis protein CcmG/thiol:disulfide interchange protein DsbE
VRLRRSLTVVRTAIAAMALISVRLSTSSVIAADVSMPPATSPPKTSQPIVAKPIEFTLPDLRGSPVSIKDLRGHPLIVDFWATWCPPCRKQIPELKAIYDRYRSHGLIVIGVACDAIEGAGVRDVKQFVKKLAINYPILIGTAAVTDKLGVEGMPTTMFVDRNGNLLTTLLGGGHNGELSETAKNLFAP